MHKPISRQAKTELLGALRKRYLRVTKREKTKVLDEFVAMGGCQRKHAIRLLTTAGPSKTEARAVDRRTYGEAVRPAVVVLWGAADRVCRKLLKAILPSLITAWEQQRQLDLDPNIGEFKPRIGCKSLILCGPLS